MYVLVILGYKVKSYDDWVSGKSEFRDIKSTEHYKSGMVRTSYPSW